MGVKRTAAVLVLFGACLLSGCKTSKDAAAAASQMALTAKALCDYYTAVETIFEKTDVLYQLNHDLYAKPYEAATQQKLRENEAEVAKRAALAADFSALAESFGKLSGSTASKDVGTAVGKLQAEVDSLAVVTTNATEDAALKTALQLLVTAVQEHKEREAATAMAGAVNGLRDLFDKEQNIWIAREILYTDVARTLAKSLVDANGTDNAPLLKVALDPFGLTALTPTPAMNTQLAGAAKNQIDARKTELDATFQQATAAMSASLHTMADRVETVAHGKPLDFPTAPLSVAAVEQWVGQFQSK